MGLCQFHGENFDERGQGLTKYGGSAAPQLPLSTLNLITE